MGTILDRCLSLARLSKSKKMGFGAVLVIDGQHFEGRNRRLKRNEKPPFPVCPWSIHAEQDALYKALRAKADVSRGVMYIAGIFTDTGEPYVVKECVSTCFCCFKLRQQYGFSPRLPTPEGWRKPKLFQSAKCVVDFRRSNTC